MIPPDRIYLQVDPEDERFQRHEGVTWSKGKIYKTDVEYVRKDYSLNLQELEKKLDKALEGETLESLTEWINEKRKPCFLKS